MFTASNSTPLHQPEQAPGLAHQRRLAAADPLIANMTLEDARTGIIPLPTVPLLVTSYAIVTSEGNGPMRGVLIMGRYLDAAEVKRLNDSVQLTFAIYRRGDPPASADVVAAWSAIERRAARSIQPLDDDTMRRRGASVRGAHR